MAQDRIKAKLAALDAVRNERGVEAVAAIRTGLADRNAVVVAKAANLAGAAALEDVEAEILSSLRRMLAPGSDDPGAEAANALAKALRDLDHRDPEPFLACLTHVRMEPVWGRRVDVAGPLRATCAQALVATDIDPHALLTLLVDRFVDTDKWVRIDVARAIAQLDRPESGLLLRLKALAGDADDEVTGQCLTSLLELEQNAALEFVSRFFKEPFDGVALDALAALAQSKLPAAFERVERFWEETIVPKAREAIVKALAASPHSGAATFLFDVFERNEGTLARAALESLAAGRFRDEWRDRVENAVAERNDATLRAAFDRSFE
jgi:hypothetical protein